MLINRDKWKSLSSEQQKVLDDQVPILESDGAKVVIAKAEQDDAKLKAAGVQDMVLTGAVRKAYLRTIYEAKWAQNDKLHYTVDYAKLKSLLYKPEQLTSETGAQGPSGKKS